MNQQTSGTANQMQLGQLATSPRVCPTCRTCPTCGRGVPHPTPPATPYWVNSPGNGHVQYS